MKGPEMLQDWEGNRCMTGEGTGLTAIRWVAGGETVAYRHTDGTVFVPSDCQGDWREYIEAGVPVGTWVDVVTGVPGVIIDGAPRKLIG